MAIQPTSNDTSAQATQDPASALASATSGDSSLGKDAFMKLLVAQIQHQDPLKPMDDTAFVSQLAQFSALEQALGTNQRLDFMAAQQKGLANTEVATLVGKNVTVKGSTVTLDGQGFAQPVHFTLDGNASTVSVTIHDSTGKAVRTIQVGAHTAGLTNVSWDGRDDNGVVQPAGAYTVSVDAKTSSGGAVGVSQETTGVLKAVSYADGYAKLVLDNGVEAPASDLISVNETTTSSK